MENSRVEQRYLGLHVPRQWGVSDTNSCSFAQWQRCSTPQQLLLPMYSTRPVWTQDKSSAL